MKDNNDKSVIKKVTGVTNVLMKTKALIKVSDIDVVWSRFENKEELITALDDHIEKLRSQDFAKLWNLIVLFAPTGSLQEISISSGWSTEYLALASEFDIAINELKQVI